MANEKPFSDKKRSNDELKDNRLHNINNTEEFDFVDFSLAFDGENEEDKGFEAQEEEFFEPNPVVSIIKGFSFRKKKNKKEEPIAEVTEKNSKPVKEKKKSKAEKKLEHPVENKDDEVIEENSDDFPEVAIEEPEKKTVLEEIEETEEIQVEQGENEHEIELLPTFEDEALVVEDIEPLEEEKPVETEPETEEIKEIPPFEDVEKVTVPVVVAEKQSKVKKKKEKKQKAPKEKKAEEKVGKSTAEPLTFKDHLTFVLIILALLLTIVFICVKFIPFGNNNSQDVNTVTDVREKVSVIELQREGAVGHYIQSDIENVFYVYSSDYSLSYYQCNNNKMTPLNISSTVNATAEVGTEKLPVKIDFVDVNGKLFGTGVFRASASQGNYYHNMVLFKLVNLPKGYEQDGKALLLATTNEDAISQKCNVWNDSFVVDLNTGKTERFLTANDSVYSTGHSILTDEGYKSDNGIIPFFTTREYDVTTNKKDIYVKEHKKETAFATDVTGSFLFTDGNAVSYLKATNTGFNAIRKVNDKETVLFSLKGDTSYLYYDEYLLDKYSGTLYNVKTGEKTAIKDYGMSNAEMMAVSNDGRFLVVLGTVNSALDYQVHIFDLKANKCAKYEDENFSQHKNLTFADDKTVVYSVVDPSRGYEYVMLDASKAF